MDESSLRCGKRRRELMLGLFCAIAYQFQYRRELYSVEFANCGGFAFVRTFPLPFPTTPFSCLWRHV
jgi:hypothetical protein